MKRLYIDVDGVLLGKHNPNSIEVRVAHHAREFLEFCLNNFDCYWLTTHCPEGDTAHVIKWLKKYADESIIELVTAIKPTSWSRIKTDAIDFSSDFYWIDDEPSSYEKETLKKNNAFGRWIKVNTCQNPDDLKRAICILQEELIEGHARKE